MGGNGEERNHSTPPSIGIGPSSLDAEAWALASRPPICGSHHRPGRQLEPIAPLAIQATAEGLMSNIQCAKLGDGGELVNVIVNFGPDVRALFAADATAWEKANSRVLNYYSGWIPVVDDAPTVIAYLRTIKDTGVFRLNMVDPNGAFLVDTSIGELGLADSIGNDIAAAIATLGLSAVRTLVTRVALRALIVDAATAVRRGIVNAAGSVTLQGIRLLFLELRGIRARQIVAGLINRGKKAIVNIGGEAASHELKEFGEHIALNDRVRMGIAKRYVPNLVKEPADNIGKVFSPNSIDRVVSRRLDPHFDPKKVSDGAFSVLKKGGTLDMALGQGGVDAAFAEQFEAALKNAGFSAVKNNSNSYFTAIKP